ncbi:MAG TPA: hypothetical protein VF868_05940 [Bacteroidia bacterium]|jgi:50S ribosomal subunit-associated GTPase HflX
MNDIMKIIKDENLEILTQDFELNPALTFAVRKSLAVKVYDRIKKIEGSNLTFLYSR